MPPGKATPAPAQDPLRVMWIIHLAFIVAGVIYLMVYQFILRDRATPPNAATSFTFAIFCMISIMSAIMGFLLPRRLAMRTPAAASTPALQYIARRKTEMILSDAFFEAICVYGMIGPLLGFSPRQSYTLMIAGLLLLTSQTGRLASWGDEYRRLLKSE